MQVQARGANHVLSKVLGGHSPGRDERLADVRSERRATGTPLWVQARMAIVFGSQLENTTLVPLFWARQSPAKCHAIQVLILSTHSRRAGAPWSRHI